MAAISSRSSLTRTSAPSWSTFTATLVPSSRTARWTWATEPEANGSDSNDANSFDTGPPRSDSTRRLGDPRRVSGDVGLKLLEFGGDVLADDIGAEAQHLTELDPGGAQLGQRVPEPAPSDDLEVLGGHLAIDQLLDRPDAGDAGTRVPPTPPGHCAPAPSRSRSTAPGASTSVSARSAIALPLVRRGSAWSS